MNTNTVELRRNLEDAEKKYRARCDRRDALHDEARRVRAERDMLNGESREVRDRIRDLKDKRDQLNTLGRKHKKLRDRYQAKAKSLISQKQTLRKASQAGGARGSGGKAAAPALDAGQIRNEIARLEEQFNISAMSKEAEAETVARIRDLNVQLAEAEQEEEKELDFDFGEDISSMDGAIDELFKRADEHHQSLIDLHNESDKFHKLIKPHQDKVDALRAMSDGRHQEYIDLKERADEVHQKVVEARELMLENRDKLREVYEAAKAEKDEHQAKVDAQFGEEALDEAADTFLELLKKGERIEI